MAATRHDAAGADQLDRFAVASTTKRDLERYVALLATWQRTHNLVAPSTLDEVWIRHIADSFQLIEHAPAGWREWVDLGSGAGLPGLVVAIASKSQRSDANDSRETLRVAADPLPIGERESPKATGEGDYHSVRPLTGPPLRSADLSPEGRGILRAPRANTTEQHVTLVESNTKKAAFLRAAIRETGANATVAAVRIESHAEKFGRRADVVSARALAPLPALLGLAEPYAHAGTLMLFLKGREYLREIEAASKTWSFDVLDSRSATDSDGRVLAIRNVGAKEMRQ